MEAEKKICNSYTADTGLVSRLHEDFKKPKHQKYNPVSTRKTAQWIKKHLYSFL